MEFLGIFHGIPWSQSHSKWYHPSSIEFYGTLVIFDMATPELLELLYEIARKSSDTWCHLNQQSPSSIEFHETLRHMIRQLGSSMEYSMEVQGNLMSIKEIISKFHGIPRNCVTSDLAAAELHGIPWNILLNSMDPWCHFKWIPTSSMEFHGTLCHLVWRRQSSMEFHGTLCHLKWNTT